MKSQTNHKIKNKEKPNDVFYTPLSLVKKHLEIVKNYVKEKDIILDPFFGDGAYYNLFEETFKGCSFEFTEIEMKRDFFNRFFDLDGAPLGV